MQPGVQTQVAKCKIDATIAIEITRHNAGPPTRAMLESLRLDADELRGGVVEHRDRHPFTHDDEVEPAVPVDVDPLGIRDHPDLAQLRGDLVRDVDKPAIGAAAQQAAGRTDAVVSDGDAATDEHVFG